MSQATTPGDFEDSTTTNDSDPNRVVLSGVGFEFELTRAELVRIRNGLYDASDHVTADGRPATGRAYMKLREKLGEAKQ